MASKKKATQKRAAKKKAAKKKAAKKAPTKKAPTKKATKQKATKQKAAKKKATPVAAGARATAGARRPDRSRRPSAAAAPSSPVAKPRAPLLGLVGGRSALRFADAGLERVVLGQPKLARRVEAMTKEVRFSVAIETPSGTRLQEARGQLAGRSLAEFRPSQYAYDHSEERLKQLGFTILRRGRFALSVRGPLELVAEVTKSKFVVASRPRFPVQRSTRLFAEATVAPVAEDLYLAPSESLTVPMRGVVAETVDDFIFVPPPLFFEPASAAAPSLGYHHLSLDQIPGILGVPAGASAQGVRVAVIDTGFADHPYYQQRGAQVTTPLLDPRVDSYGHGTAVTANVFAVAPDADVYLFEQSDPPQDALEVAVEQGARVLSCSWGWDHEQSFPILEATIRDLVEEGVIVLFASGNGHHAWPSTMPEVLSVGGVYQAENGQLEASNYASGFLSSLYPNPPRRVPDVCGLCGQSPRGIYIPMPCAPGCEMDRRYGGPGFPDQDETGKTDGWVVASGTSSATPQIAGVVALMLREAAAQGKQLPPAVARGLLEQSSRAVTQGRNAFGFPAVGQPNTACGWGLVDAATALASIGGLP